MFLETLKVKAHVIVKRGMARLSYAGVHKFAVNVGAAP